MTRIISNLLMRGRSDLRIFQFQKYSKNGIIPTVRLTPNERHIIETTIRRRDPEAEIYLFGSRADDGAKGGDIDLMVISDLIDLREEISIRREIQDAIGWQKLDLIVRSSERKYSPIAEIARQTGLLL
jgi:hypothetical protein